MALDKVVSKMSKFFSGPSTLKFVPFFHQFRPAFLAGFFASGPPFGGLFYWGIEMQTITITVDDDTKITVAVEEDGQMVGELYECSSTEECLQYVQSVIRDDSMSEASDEMTGEAEPSEDYSSMWNQESKMRGEKMSQPGEY